MTGRGIFNMCGTLNTISSFHIGDLQYVCIEDDCGNSISLPFEDWKDAQRYLGLTISSPDLIQRIENELYVDVGTRLVHEW